MTAGDKSSLKSWYLVYTKPRQEETALANLVRQDYTVYLPLARDTRKRHGYRAQRTEPLFPRYLFIYLDARNDNWGPIRSTLGVASLVKFGQVPACIPDELVEFLITSENETGLHEWAEHNYQIGDKVRLTEGAFQGYQGILLATTGRERVIVLLDVLGRQIRTRVQTGQLELD